MLLDIIKDSTSQYNHLNFELLNINTKNVKFDVK